MKNQLWKSFVVLAAATLVWGCPKSADDAAKAGETGKNGAAASASNGAADSKPATLDSLPANLKHEGYEYYGLGQTQALGYEVISTVEPGASKGDSTSQLQSIEGGTAKFVTTRTGPLAALGEQILELRPDGVYSTSMAGNKIEPPQLELPAELPVGKTWSTKGSVKLPDGRTLEQDLQYKVVGEEKVQTKAGEFDALKVTVSGQIKFGEEPNQSQVSAWYVKGIGVVKMTISTTNPRNTMSVQLYRKPGAS